MFSRFTMENIVVYILHIFEYSRDFTEFGNKKKNRGIKATASVINCFNGFKTCALTVEFIGRSASAVLTALNSRSLGSSRAQNVLHAETGASAQP